MNWSPRGSVSRARRGVPFALAAGPAKLAFLRKTYAIFTAGIVAAFGGAMVALYAGDPTAIRLSAERVAMVPPLVALVAAHPLLVTLLFFGGFFGLRAASQSRSAGIPALLAFTFFTGLMIGPTIFVAGLLGGAGAAMTANPARDAFVLALGAFGGLTGYVFVSRRDFSFIGGMLSMGIVVLLVASLIGMFVGGASFHLAIASVGVLLFGGYVLYDTSRLLHANEPISPVDAATMLYLDFFNLFLFILQILMSSRRDD
jgi:modulator of FtsH protease